MYDIMTAKQALYHCAHRFSHSLRKTGRLIPSETWYDSIPTGN